MMRRRAGAGPSSLLTACLGFSCGSMDPGGSDAAPALDRCPGVPARTIDPAELVAVRSILSPPPSLGDDARLLDDIRVVHWSMEGSVSSVAEQVRTYRKWLAQIRRQYRDPDRAIEVARAELRAMRSRLASRQEECGL